MIARNFERHHLFPANRAGGVDDNESAFMRHAYENNLRRNEYLYSVIYDLSRQFEDNAVPVAFRKGAILARRVYEDIGIRPMNDIDVLVDKTRVQDIVEVLHGMGFYQGRILADGTMSKTKRNRRTELTWELYASNLPPFFRKGDGVHVQHVAVDVTHSLFLPKSGFRLKTGDVVGRAEKVVVGDEAIMGLETHDMLIDLCGHLYKEATTLWWIQHKSDLHLIKFCDIAMLIARTKDRLSWPKFISRVVGSGLEKPMYYSLYFAELLYPGSVPASALNAIRPSDISYLEAYGEMELGKPKTWQNSFIDRLFQKDREREAAASKFVEGWQP